MQQLNTQLWNLGTTSFVAALGLSAAACGPAVGIEGDTDGGETESASDTIIDPSGSTDPTDPTTPTDPTGCNLVPCGDGYICEEDHCDRYEPPCDYDYDDDCYCYYGHCQPPYDCYDDDECGSGQICEYGNCEALQALPDCGTPATLVGTPLQIPTGNPIEALSFVDLDPLTDGEDLVVGTDIDGWLLPAVGGEPIALPSDGAVRGGASADLDGDGASDLMLIDDAGLTVHFGFGTEASQAVSLPSAQPFTAVQVLANIEGLPSLALLDDAGAVSIVPGSSERLLQPAPAGLPVVSPAVIESFAPGDGSQSVAWESPGPDTSYLYAPDPPTLTPIGLAPRNGGLRSMAVGELTGADSSSIVWTTDFEDWTFVEVLLGGEGSPIALRAIYFNYETLAIGDLDGNGLDDALVVGEGGLAVMPGDARWGLTCFSQSPFIGGASRIVALGDLDADGTDEAIVVTDAGGPPMQYDVSWTP